MLSSVAFLLNTEIILEIFLFTLVAVALYFFSDWVLRALEQRRGAPLPYRNIIFFAIILTLSMASFQLLQHFLPQSGAS